MRETQPQDEAKGQAESFMKARWFVFLPCKPIDAERRSGIAVIFGACKSGRVTFQRVSAW